MGCRQGGTEYRIKRQFYEDKSLELLMGSFGKLLICADVSSRANHWESIERLWVCIDLI